MRGRKGESQMTNKTAALFLKVNGLGTIIVGFLLALVAFPPLAAPGIAMIDFVDWPVDGAVDLDRISRTLSAVSGGLTAGLGACFLFLVAPLVERGDPLARSGGALTLLIWYGIDSAGSIAAGAPLNAVTNTLFLMLLLVPLLLAGKRVPEASG